MKVICNNVVGLPGPADPTGAKTTIYHDPGSEIEVPDEDVYRLLKLGAIRMPGDPDPTAAQSDVSADTDQRRRVSLPTLPGSSAPGRLTR